MEKSINISDVYEKLKEIERTMATKKELAQAFETICVLSNEETMKQIDSSASDIERGKFRQISSIEDL